MLTKGSGSPFYCVLEGRLFFRLRGPEDRWIDTQRDLLALYGLAQAGVWATGAGVGTRPMGCMV